MSQLYTQLSLPMGHPTLPKTNKISVSMSFIYFVCICFISAQKESTAFAAIYGGASFSALIIILCGGCYNLPVSLPRALGILSYNWLPVVSLASHQSENSQSEELVTRYTQLFLLELQRED